MMYAAGVFPGAVYTVAVFYDFCRACSPAAAGQANMLIVKNTGSYFGRNKAAEPPGAIAQGNYPSGAAIGPANSLLLLQKVGQAQLLPLVYSGHQQPEPFIIIDHVQLQ